jgi:D-amino-acid oxidase
VRGQIVVLAPQPEVQLCLHIARRLYVSAADGIMLGGTFERGEWSTIPEPATIQRIVETIAAVLQLALRGLNCTGSAAPI